jgi:hypothetical protein
MLHAKSDEERMKRYERRGRKDGKDDEPDDAKLK